ncbi:hypothetical protein FA15DRAFT_165056 [Coprinopsis marcescibilis]|uniref:Zinc finger PHD-type domain-containing protein n=1 Tax=Coprinopsis marcescibilis TaxID=230819 RepID=A0A5C3KI20_COPMA|nr:hypothetical protein FA15DRAFT_165056 [Coprinopsis marcescibilis]
MCWCFGVRVGSSSYLADKQLLKVNSLVSQLLFSTRFLNTCCISLCLLHPLLCAAFHENAPILFEPPPHMPRRSSRQVTVIPVPEIHSLPVLEPLDDNLTTLRRHWKWAAFTQFFYIFHDLFAINDISVTDLESDLVHGTDIFLPRIMTRLLYTVSFDRKITVENWQNALRKQYDKRDPEANPLGPYIPPATAHSRYSSILKEEPTEEPSTEAGDEKETVHENGAASGPSSRQPTEEPAHEESSTHTKEEEHETPAHPTVNWSDLTMLQKLDSMHLLTEWQFQNPLRLRGLMKSDDELATWRSEPIGYDRMQNAYWLIGGNRLWIQRALPKPPTKKRKRKEPPAKGKAKQQQKPAKRRKTQEIKKEAPPKKAIETPISNGRSRAAKEKAKVKLDAQAKALAEFQRQQASGSFESSRPTRRSGRGAPPSPEKKTPKTPPTRGSGTRISSRLRNLQDDGWETVPQELLDESDGKQAKTGLESDEESISDLTELSDDDASEPQSELEEEEKEKSPTPEPEPEPEPVNENFVEWETLCVTLAEWESFPEQFAKSTHYTERAFYKYLTTEIIPDVVAELKELEHKRRLEEALSHRKRSSRLAQREHDKEAAKIAAHKKAEEDAQNARTRRLEARQQREEEERLKKEKAREERRANREAKAVNSTRDNSMARSSHEDDHPSSDADSKTKAKSNGQAKSVPRGSKTSTGSRTPNEDWELDCEICGKRGKNLDDGKPMMSCGYCSKWQHIPCHDKKDQAQGRPKRDWNKIEFFCQRCLVQRHPPRPSVVQPHPQQYPQAYPQPYPTQQHLSSTGYSQYQRGVWQNGSYADPRTQAYAPAQDHYSRATLGQTSSVRSSAYPQPPPVYPGPSQSHTISFSHYQPQERAFSSDPSRGAQPRPNPNPYLHTVTSNNGWPVDQAKYPVSPPMVGSDHS